MRRLAVLGVTLSLLSLSGCASSGRDGRRGVERSERYFLLRPTEGYPRTVPTSTRERLDDAHARLLERLDTATATEVAADLLGQDPSLAPARVLWAQSMFVEGQDDKVVTELLPVVEEYDAYTAAHLLFGRSSEKLGNLVQALVSYRAIEEKSPLGRSRALEIEPRAREIVALRIEDALTRGDPGRAEAELERLESWAPDSPRTFELTAAVARALEDPGRELAALRRLTTVGETDLGVLERRARLEMEVGDPATGLRLLEVAASRDPENLELAEAVTRARFLWRLQLLPRDVQEMVRRSELTRGDLATLVYWVFPEVRYGRGGGARIANDILEHPYREQIVKVVNAGIMDVDDSLHRFEPYRAVTRGEALTAMLRLLGRQSPAVACLGGPGVPLSMTETCRVASRCGIVPTEDDCLPFLPLSGSEAIELFRLTQDHLVAD